jgi:hypothetical protein
VINQTVSINQLIVFTLTLLVIVRTPVKRDIQELFLPERFYQHLVSQCSYIGLDNQNDRLAATANKSYCMAVKDKLKVLSS